MQVNIPGGAAFGEQDGLTLSVRSQGSPALLAASTLTSRAGALYGLALSPPAAAQSGLPGERLAYTLHLTNTGNLSATFSLSASGSWPFNLPPALGPLAAGQGLDFSVQVSLPLTAALGAQDVILVRAVSQAQDSLAASSQLLSTVAAAPTAPYALYFPSMPQQARCEHVFDPMLCKDFPWLVNFLRP